MLLFFYQDKKKPSAEGREVWPGTSRIAGGSQNSRPPSGTPPNLAGVPDALIFFCFFSSIKTRKGPLPRAGKFGRVHREQSKVSNLAGVPDALIFFCFFSCIKARKEDHEARESCIKARKEEGSKQKSQEKQIKGRRFTPHIRGQGVGLSCLAPKSIREGALGASRGGWTLPAHGWGLNHTFARML